jgi:hypothetical protein
MPNQNEITAAVSALYQSIPAGVRKFWIVEGGTRGVYRVAKWFDEGKARAHAASLSNGVAWYKATAYHC